MFYTYSTGDHGASRIGANCKQEGSPFFPPAIPLQQPVLTKFIMCRMAKEKCLQHLAPLSRQWRADLELRGSKLVIVWLICSPSQSLFLQPAPQLSRALYLEQYPKPSLTMELVGGIPPAILPDDLYSEHGSPRTDPEKLWMSCICYFPESSLGSIDPNSSLTVSAITLVSTQHWAVLLSFTFAHLPGSDS